MKPPRVVPPSPNYYGVQQYGGRGCVRDVICCYYGNENALLEDDDIVMTAVPPVRPKAGEVYLFKPDDESNAGKC